MIENPSLLPQPEPRPVTPEALASEIIDKLTYGTGKDAKAATRHDWLTATILVIRDRIIDHWMASTRRAYADNAKRVYYLSLEFLIGRLMRDAVTNLELQGAMRQALARLGAARRQHRRHVLAVPGAEYPLAGIRPRDGDVGHHDSKLVHHAAHRQTGTQIHQ